MYIKFPPFFIKINKKDFLYLLSLELILFTKKKKNDSNTISEQKKININLQKPYSCFFEGNNFILNIAIIL